MNFVTASTNRLPSGLIKSLKNLGVADHYQHVIDYFYQSAIIASVDEAYFSAFLFNEITEGSSVIPLKGLIERLTLWLTAAPEVSLNQSIDQLLSNKKLFGDHADQVVPFILNGQQIISRPYLLHEQEVISNIKVHLIQPSETMKEFFNSEAIIKQLSLKYPMDPIVHQAIETILRRNLLILTGGPGFGKTTALSLLLQSLLLQSLQMNKKACSVLLAAPTGRAAARMAESLKTSTILPSLEPFVPARAQTLHRLLRYNPLTDSCAYHEERPLDFDVLAVDESSMIDRRLFNHLLKALPSHGKLILMGDANQLSSVGHGSVLEDLLQNHENPAHPFHHQVAVLTKSYRSHQDIFQLASTALEGDHNQLFLLLSQQNPFIESLNIEAPNYFIQRVVNEFCFEKLPPKTVFTHHPKKFTDQEKAFLQKFFDCYNNFIILSPLREHNAYSAKAINEAINRRLSSTAVYHGQSIIITSNDDKLQLANGDRGVILEIDKEFFAFFEHHQEAYPVDYLKNWDSAYALTIHKSQGSEFSKVAIVIPPQSGRVLNRNLLYTALTRAKNNVMLIKDDHELKTALSRPQKRYSTIPQALMANE